MSYGIVRVQKFKAGSVKGIEIHDKRDKDHSHTNKEIDWNRSKSNYDLNMVEGTFRQAIKKRIEELDLPKAVRKDAVVMAQVLVTSDKTFFDKLSPEETKQFFKQSYDFLKERYGEKNVISATVHMDEKTPHMHFNFVPVTDDGRLSAKSILNRMDLIKQHDDFYKEVGKDWGLSRGEKEGYKKHIETADFKKQTAYKELEEVESNLEVLVSKKNSVKNELEELKSDFERVKDIKVNFDNINAIEGKYGLVDKKKVKVNSDDFKMLKDIAKRQHVLESKIEFLEKENSSMKSDIDKFASKNMDRYERDIGRERTLQKMSKELDTVKDYLEENNQLEDYRNFREQQRQAQIQMKKALDELEI